MFVYCSILVLDFLLCPNCNTWSALSVMCFSDQNANSASGNFLSELTLCQRELATSATIFNIFHNLILFSLFSHRVFNVTGHGTVAPLTKRFVGCAGTSPLRPSPLLLHQLALPQQTLLQGTVSVHLVSQFFQFSASPLAVNRTLIARTVAPREFTGASSDILRLTHH